MNPLQNLWYTITGQTKEQPPLNEVPERIREIKRETDRTGLPLTEIERFKLKYNSRVYGFLTAEPGSKEERHLAASTAAIGLSPQHCDAHNITTLAQWLISTRTPQAETTWQARRDRAADDIQLLNDLRYTLDLTEEQTAKINTAIDHIRAKHGLGNF